MEYVLSASVCMALFFSVYRFALRSDTQFARNRYYLLFGLAASLILPLIRVPISSEAPVWQNHVALQPLVLGMQATLMPLGRIIGIVYLCGVLVRMGVFLFQLGKLVAITASYLPEPFEGALRIRTYALPTSSFWQYLFWHPDPTLSAAETHRLLDHELAHIRQGHTWDILLAEVICIFFWFLPFAYMLRQALRDQHEYLADAAATRSAASRTDYIKQLVTAYLVAHDLPLSHGFRSSQLHRRLRMLRKRASQSWTHIKLLLVLPILMAAVAATPLATQHLELHMEGAFSEGDQTQHAAPVQGWADFYRAFREQLTRDQVINAYGVQGQYALEFVIGAHGEIEWVSVRNTPSRLVGIVSVRTFYNLDTTWKPAMKDGKPVAERFTLPIRLQPGG